MVTTTSPSRDDERHTAPTRELSAEDVALLPYSSGTAGLPKDVVLSYRNLVASFSVHPGILPIGLSEPALAGTAPADSPQGRLREWVRQELAAGRGAEPHQVAELLLRIATGEIDGLSGRHLSVHDDLDTLLSRTDDVLRDDLYVLRVRTLSSNSATSAT